MYLGHLFPIETYRKIRTVKDNVYECIREVDFNIFKKVKYFYV